jgi:hypothetical protein
METNTVVIRVRDCDLRKLYRIFPKLRKESKADYLRRYILELQFSGELEKE